MGGWLNAVRSSNKAMFFRKLGPLGENVLLFFLPKRYVTVSVVFLESSRINNTTFRFIHKCCEPCLIGEQSSKFLC